MKIKIISFYVFAFFALSLTDSQTNLNPTGTYETKKI